jgi:cob(I)alamin adenosyltransferase
MTGNARQETPLTRNQGLVMVITGNGKGKTTSALGQAIRAMGHGWKVCVIQFMKGRKYGEVLCAEQYLPDLTIHQCGQDSFVTKGKLKDVDIALAHRGLELAKKVLYSGEYDLVILDEINVTVDFQLIPLPDVLAAIRNRPDNVNVILTGRCARTELIEMADMVSEIREIKHHYAKGVKERAGIEF